MKITRNDIKNSVARGIVNMVTDVTDIRDTVIDIAGDAVIDAEGIYMNVSDKLWEKFGIIF